MKGTFTSSCGFAGDVSQPKNRKGCYSCMVIIRGGSGDVKLLTSDTAEGEYTEYKTLVKNANANTLEGVFVNLDGAKLYIKVVGADSADVVFGDCDFDPKEIEAEGNSNGIIHRLYAWDYGGGVCVGYTEQAEPVEGDLIYLKEGMAEGEIEDVSELKLAYHVVSDIEGVIIVSEHPEGETGGYNFVRDEEKDIAEKITEIKTVSDIAEEGLIFSQNTTAFKSLKVDIE